MFRFDWMRFQRKAGDGPLSLQAIACLRWLCRGNIGSFPRAFPEHSPKHATERYALLHVPSRLNRKGGRLSNDGGFLSLSVCEWYETIHMVVWRGSDKVETEPPRGMKWRDEIRISGCDAHGGFKVRARRALLLRSSGRSRASSPTTLISVLGWRWERLSGLLGRKGPEPTTPPRRVCRPGARRRASLGSRSGFESCSGGVR